MAEQIEGLHAEIGRLNDICRELNDKNRRLNEKLNEVIFDKATNYKQKTMEALKQSPSRYSEQKDPGYYQLGA